jgi:hypothetical protein
MLLLKARGTLTDAALWLQAGRALPWHINEKRSPSTSPWAQLDLICFRGI